jgi:hypothetical protein
MSILLSVGVCALEASLISKVNALRELHSATEEELRLSPSGVAAVRTE